MEKGGLLEALWGVGLSSGREAWHSDEMRLGLRGQSRKVLAPRGAKVVQKLRLRYEWSYLILAVSPLTGEIRWEWIERMRQEQIHPVLEKWDLEAVVWDRAPSHRAKSLGELLRTARVFLPSYNPELDPAERIFEEARRRVEGKVYEDLTAKRQEAESYLQELRGDPERVKSFLCGWEWLRESLESLPDSTGSGRRRVLPWTPARGVASASRGARPPGREKPRTRAISSGTAGSLAPTPWRSRRRGPPARSVELLRDRYEAPFGARAHPDG